MLEWFDTKLLTQFHSPRAVFRFSLVLSVLSAANNVSKDSSENERK